MTPSIQDQTEKFYFYVNYFLLCDTSFTKNVKYLDLILLKLSESVRVGKQLMTVGTSPSKNPD